MPSRTSYMPSTTRGIGTMLTAFASNIPGALATKYNVTNEEVTSVVQGHLVWTWFDTRPCAWRGVGPPA